MQAIRPEPDFRLGEYLNAWLAHVGGRVRQKTWEGYESLIRLYARPAIGDVTLAELHPLQLQQLYSSLLAKSPPLSGGTVLNLHLVLAQALSQAVRWGYLASSPAAAVQPPRPRRPEVAVVDEALAERLLDAVGGTYFEVPVSMAIATGMRRGEILALRWADVDEDLAIARVNRTLQTTSKGLVFELPKTRRSKRAIVLPQFIRTYLARQREDQARRRIELGARWHDLDLVVDAGDGSPLHPSKISSRWGKFLRQAGLPHLRFHDLRHAHATLMLRKGVHPKIVSERLGHASIGITLDTYSHVLPSMQQQAADAFDELFPTSSE